MKSYLMFVIIVLLVGSVMGYGVYWLCIQRAEYNQVVQVYLQTNPYEGEINQYATYIGVVGVIVDRCVEGIEGEFHKEYKLRFPSNVICSDFGKWNQASTPFVEVWVREGAIIRLWELR